MIKLTWGNLRDRDFMNSMAPVFAKPMGYDMGCRFVILGKEIKKQQKLCDETHEGLLKKYGTPDKEKPGVYQLAEATRAEYADEMKKLNAHEFTVRILKFDALKLNDIIPLSPQDLMLLEPILLPFEIPAGQESKHDGSETNVVEMPAPATH